MPNHWLEWVVVIGVPLAFGLGLLGGWWDLRRYNRRRDRETS